MTGDTIAVHPAVREYLDSRTLRDELSPSRIASRHGMTRQNLHRLVTRYLNESGPGATNATEANDSNLSEKVGATATDSSLPSLPDQPEDRAQTA